MKYSINGSTVSLSKDILSEESLNTMIEEIDSSYNSCSKAIEAYNLVSNVKAMESFGYKATEGLGEKLKAGAKIVWGKIKEFFKRIGKFFKKIYSKVKIKKTENELLIIEKKSNQLMNQQLALPPAKTFETYSKLFDILKNPNEFNNKTSSYINNVKQFEKLIPECEKNLDLAWNAQNQIWKYDSENNRYNASAGTPTGGSNAVTGAGSMSYDGYHKYLDEYKTKLHESVEKIKPSIQACSNAAQDIESYLKEIHEGGYKDVYVNDFVKEIKNVHIMAKSCRDVLTELIKGENDRLCGMILSLADRFESVNNLRDGIPTDTDLQRVVSDFGRELFKYVKDLGLTMISVERFSSLIRSNLEMFERNVLEAKNIQHE